MANEEHLTQLKKGVDSWNHWRKENTHIRPDLSDANLSHIDLSGADFGNANLKGANLSEANLSRINLKKANLVGANLSKTCLKQAVLNDAILNDAKLREANLKGAYLRGTYLIRTELTRAILSNADFFCCQALAANFTGAILTGACLADWNINSETKLDEVICEYVYLRQNQRERRPLSGTFAPGEFTKLFQKSLETVDLIFRNGVDWDAFAYSFKKVEVENQDAQLDVQSIEKKGDGILVVRVSVSPDANKAKIHGDFTQGYEFAHKALEAQYQVRLEDKDKEINRLFYLLDKANEQLGEVPKLLAENPRKVSNYYQQNSQFAGGVVDAETVQSQQIGGNIQNTDNEE